MAESVNNIIHAKAPKRIDLRTSYVGRADTAVLEHELGADVSSARTTRARGYCCFPR